MLFSIIIPAYNASNTIRRCLDSVDALPLDRSEFEVLIIDDCSTDETVSILREYQAHHANCTILLQPENHRQGAARNRGLSIAKGKYIIFLDSDDEISGGILSAIKMAESNNLEMVALKTERVSLDNSMIRLSVLPYKANAVFSGVELQCKHPFWGTAPWAYVYLSSFLRRVGYPFAEDVVYEDSDFVNVHLYRAQRMSYCDECAFRIHENRTSTTHVISYRHVCDYALLGTRMLAFYQTLEDKDSVYSESILEGGSYNIMRSFRSLFRLDSKSAIQSFYDRFDRYASRESYIHYRTPAYCWTGWTRFCLKHKKMAIFFIGAMLPFYSLLSKIYNR